MLRLTGHFRAIWLTLFSLLALSSLVHSYEHWEIVSNDHCISHSDHSGSDTGGHDHGCSSHEHGSAIFETPFVLQIQPNTTRLGLITEIAPPPVFKSIDQPPKLS